MHIYIVQGDFTYPMWEDGAYDEYRRKIHELRIKGYRKIDESRDSLNFYEYYRRKGKKKVITVTTMYP